MRRGYGLVAAIVLLLAKTTSALGWRSTKPKYVDELAIEEPNPFLPSLHAGRVKSNTYSTALSELQELESKPFCHRVAARLLVNNCQLLNGQDDATIMTDTGRSERDFVDFFAASLAICDLERANFEIPETCYKFREPFLASLPVPSKPKLHVTSTEIVGCLEGLGHTHNAWSTWLSYRHKALGFCEASRAEGEKDNQIMLYRKLADILERLTNEAEVEARDRLQKLDQMLQSSNDKAEAMDSYVDKFQTNMQYVDRIITHSILAKSKETELFVNKGFEDAKSLQRLLEELRATIDLREKERAETYETALDLAASQVNRGAHEVAEILRAVAISSLSLQEQMQEGMNNLNLITENITRKQKYHEEALNMVQNKTDHILESLEAATFSLGNMQAHFSGFDLAGRWPCILFPIASLFLGSYGLEPSITRNILLLSAGEVAGFMMALAKDDESKI